MFDLDQDPPEYSRGSISNPLLDPPPTRSRRLLRAFALSLLGLLFGALPAFLVFCIMTFDAHTAVWKIIGGLFLIFCFPLMLLFFILGYTGQGNIIHRLLEWMGKTKANGMSWGDGL
jgi:hypothetical protein